MDSYKIESASKPLA